MLSKEDIGHWFRQLQDKICFGLEAEDGSGKFKEDAWQREQGGGGRTRVIAEGKVFEKGGVNFSAVFGPTPPSILQALDLPPSDFYATGVSIVIHPHSPLIPIIHMNVRYFEMSNGTFWFGGGIDLTPHYIVPEDARYFHEELKKTCDRYHCDFYEKFSKWADDYFYIPHRKETRGVGGVFFDRLQTYQGMTKEDLFEFVKGIGETFLPVYKTLVSKYKNKTWTPEQQLWQRLRRGRYVEFNLVYDKGTKFGLDTDGRTESILMSLPQTASWLYDYHPEPGSEEEKTLGLLKKDMKWA
jgi:coproporphyrinogen III oxidase